MSVQAMKLTKLPLPRRTVSVASTGWTDSMSRTITASLAPIRIVGRAWNAMAAKSTYAPTIVTGGTILCISDTTAQYITQWAMHPDGAQPMNFQWDRRRTLALSTFGALYFGVACKRLYQFYDYLFLKMNNQRWLAHRRDSRCARPWSGKQIAVYKALTDCCVHTPFVLLPVFYFLTGAIKGQSVDEITTQLRTEWATAAMSTCMYWIPLMSINFLLVPVAWRVFYISALSFFQKSALSWYSNRTRMASMSDAVVEGAMDVESTEDVVDEVTRRALDLSVEMQLPWRGQKTVKNAALDAIGRFQKLQSDVELARPFRSV